MPECVVEISADKHVWYRVKYIMFTYKMKTDKMLQFASRDLNITKR